MRSEGSGALAPSGGRALPMQRLATSACELAPCPESVGEARRFTRETLQRWGLAELFDDVALVASELVTNALRHGVGAEGIPHPAGRCAPPAPRGFPTAAVGPARRAAVAPAAARPAETAPVRLSLAHWTSRVVCSVRDPSTQGPMTRTPDFIAESGRGLHLVASCSDAWGWHPLAGAGKVVWALFPTPGRD